jgi:hypothetical protein
MTVNSGTSVSATLLTSHIKKRDRGNLYRTSLFNAEDELNVFAKFFLACTNAFTLLVPDGKKDGKVC